MDIHSSLSVCTACVEEVSAVVFISEDDDDDNEAKRRMLMEEIEARSVAFIAMTS